MRHLMSKFPLINSYNCSWTLVILIHLLLYQKDKNGFTQFWLSLKDCRFQNIIGIDGINMSVWYCNWNWQMYFVSVGAQWLLPRHILAECVHPHQIVRWLSFDGKYFQIWQLRSCRVFFKHFYWFSWSVTWCRDQSFVSRLIIAPWTGFKWQKNLHRC